MNKSYHLQEAARLDNENPLSTFRKRFHIPPGTIYMDGNSLGLLSKDAEASLLRVLDEWKNLGIDGWMNGKQPWFWFAEEMGKSAAELVGAGTQEVIYTGTTTINIHNLVGSFFQPDDVRNKILADSLNFPSDLYALQGQLRLRNLDPETHLILAEAGSDGLLDEDSIIEQMRHDVAIVFLPSVLYRSSQLLDMEKLTSAAHERGIVIGFDCSHSAGILPHQFSKWDVDFALWCSYKYLNAGPGAAAFIYVNKKHFNLLPSLPGWFGQQKDLQFDMLSDFNPAPHSGRWQISSPGILGSSPMEGALKITLEAGIMRIREVSLQLTDFLAGSISTRIIPRHSELAIITPPEPHRRGGHIAVKHPGAENIHKALLSKGIITDLRPPNIIRIAPVPLYNTFREVYHVADLLLEVIDSI
jgi:kynureninase